METIQYQEARKHMKTGDVIAFSGKGGVSEAIKTLAKMKGGLEISHVASVIRLPGSDWVQITESTMLTDLPDAQTGLVHKGLQIQWLSHRLKTYEGEVYWAPLREKLSAIQEEKFLECVREFHRKAVPYDTIQALGAGIDFWDRWCENERDLSALFCSEWCAFLLQSVGKFEDTINYSEVQPFEVVTHKAFERMRKLLS